MTEGAHGARRGPAILCFSGQGLKAVPDMKGENTHQLDLSDNEISNPVFQSAFCSLVSLNLSANPITSLSGLALKNLRFLLLDFCGLESLSGIAPLPSLMTLSLVGNNLASYEGFRVFPNLRTLDLRGNRFDFADVLTVAAVGSLHLESVNGKELVQSEFEEAFRLSPIVGYALRRGRSPELYENEKAVSVSFLSSEEPLRVRNMGGCLVLRCPRDGNVKWYQSADREDEWELLDCTAKTIPVTPLMNCHLVKCVCENDDGVFEYYTEDAIGDVNVAVAPFPVIPAIVGNPSVGSLLIASSTQSCASKVRWLVNGVKVGDGRTLEITQEMESKKVTAEIRPYSIKFPDVIFGAVSNEVQIEPCDQAKLLKLEIKSIPEEDKDLLIEYETFPPGMNLDVVLEKADDIDKPYSEIAKLRGTTYQPVLKDVGKFLRASAKVGGRVFYVYCDKPVARCPPKIRRAVIAGSCKIHHPLLVLVEFSDGVEREWECSWYTQNGSDGAKTDVNKKGKLFVPPPEMENCYLIAQISAKFGKAIQQFSVRSERSLEASPPPLEIPGQEVPTEDTKLTMMHTGKWSLSNLDAPDGFEMVVESDAYTPKGADIGKYLRFTSDMIDTILGQVQPSMSPIQQVSLVCESDTVGSILKTVLTFYPGRNTEATIRWIRCSRSGKDTIVQEGNMDYIVSTEDIGSKIKVRAFVGEESTAKESEFTPIIKRGMFQTTAIAGQCKAGMDLTALTPAKVEWFHEFDDTPIFTGKVLHLTYMDVGHKIRMKVTKKGKAVYNELTAEEVVQDPVFENQTINLSDVFHHDAETGYGNLWFRFDFLTNEWDEIAKGSSYTLTSKDVDSVIRVVSVELLDDGSKGREVFADITSIRPASKSPENMPHLIFNSHGHLQVTCGRFEKGSKPKFVWRRWRNGRAEEIKNATDKKLTPHPSMVGCQIEAGCTLPGSDELIWTGRVLVEKALPVPKAELVEEGSLVSGCLLRVNVTPVPNVKTNFRWKRWDGSSFYRLSGKEGESTYIVTNNDVDCYVCCDIYFSDDTGARGSITSVETSGPIESGTSLSIEGQALCGKVLSITGDEGFLENASVFWQRKVEKSKWIEVGQKATYRCNCDDVGHLMRVLAVTDEEEKASDEVGPVLGDETITRAANELLKSGSFKFKGRDGNQNHWNFDVGHTIVSVKSRSTSKTVPLKSFSVKASTTSERKLEVIAGNTLKMGLYPSIALDSLDAFQVRDVCIQAVKILKHRASESSPHARRAGK